MLTRVQKWGNSLVVRLPRKILEEAKIAVGDEVDVTVSQGRIIVASTERIRGRYRLEDLVAQMPEDYEPCEEDGDVPVGIEVW